MEFSTGKRIGMMCPSVTSKNGILGMTVCAALFLFSGPLLAQEEIESREVASREAIKSLSESLKVYLKAGLENEIDAKEKLLMCKEGAMEATALTNEKYPFEIGRTGLRVRNPSNQPDEWESSILLKFEERMNSGESIKAIEHSAILQINGKKHFRYMKAIPVGKVCLSCHGTAIEPKVLAMLNTIYPHDEARGFKIGDIRGAFTVREILK